MKTISRFYALCLAILAGMITVFGQPQSLPIKSQDALREYALGHVVRGFRDVMATSMVWLKNQPTWVEARGASAEDVLDKLFGKEIVYSLANIQDAVEGRVWLYDEWDNLLFFGSARYSAADIGKAGPSYNIWMQDIPLLEKVQQAEVLVLDADGVTVRRQNLEVDQKGHLLFGSWLAGAPNGILSVRFQDGSVVTYELWNPVGEKPTSVTESGPSWKIEGHHLVTAGEKPETRIVKVIEPWARPTVLLTVTSADAITFDVMGIVQENGSVSFERPTSMEVTRLGPDGKTAESGTVALNPTSSTVLRVDAGKYRIRFNWVKFGQPNTLYAGPEDGGGMG